MTQRLLGLALALLLVAAACSSSSDTPSEETDRVEPADHDFVLGSGCGERTLIGSYSINVRDRGVKTATALDESAEAMLASTGIDPVPTIGELVDATLVALRPNRAQPDAMIRRLRVRRNSVVDWRYVGEIRLLQMQLYIMTGKGQYDLHALVPADRLRLTPTAYSGFPTTHGSSTGTIAIIQTPGTGMHPKRSRSVSPHTTTICGQSSGRNRWDVPERT